MAKLAQKEANQWRKGTKNDAGRNQSWESFIESCGMPELSSELASKVANSKSKSKHEVDESYLWNREVKPTETRQTQPLIKYAPRNQATNSRVDNYIRESKDVYRWVSPDSGPSQKINPDLDSLKYGKERYTGQNWSNNNVKRPLQKQGWQAGPWDIPVRPRHH